MRVTVVAKKAHTTPTDGTAIALNWKKVRYAIYMWKAICSC